MEIYIWGIGATFANASKQLPIDLEQITAYVDNNHKIEHFMGKPVINPVQLCDCTYEAIFVFAGKEAVKEIYKQCKEIKLDLSKVIFWEENSYLCGLNQNYCVAEKMLGTEYVKILENKQRIIRSNLLEDLSYNESQHKDMYESDYIRVKTLELVAEEIKSNRLEGNVAELGVFRGEFAKHLHDMFPDKTLYLFDTFEGFNEKEANREIERGYINKLFFESYKDTSIELCLSKMKNRDKICIKQGLFPESLEGLEDSFSFVSIDVDLEESIYKGLEYFYPRLVKGGYIFIHDYNSFLYGVKKAIRKYEKDHNIYFCKVPICDIAGTLIITKS